MMRPITLEEFAQQLRVAGDYREKEFGDAILALLDIEKEVADPYYTLCDDLNHYVPANPDKPEKQLEWLGDRNALLVEIEAELEKAGLDGDADDVIKDLIERTPPKLEYDL